MPNSHKQKLLASQLYDWFDHYGYANTLTTLHGEYTDICIDGYYDLEELAGKILGGEW